jgi:DNA-binding transcriptional ArsR family regulator
MHMTDLCKEIANMGRGIGNEKRYRIFETLMKSPLAVGQIAKKLRLPQPAVSQHLKVLKSANLVTAQRESQEVLYAINIPYVVKLLKKLAMNLPHIK